MNLSKWQTESFLFQEVCWKLAKFRNSFSEWNSEFISDPRHNFVSAVDIDVWNVHLQSIDYFILREWKCLHNVSVFAITIKNQFHSINIQANRSFFIVFSFGFHSKSFQFEIYAEISQWFSILVILTHWIKLNGEKVR